MVTEISFPTQKFTIKALVTNLLIFSSAVTSGDICGVIAKPQRVNVAKTEIDSAWRPCLKFKQPNLTFGPSAFVRK